MRSIKAALAALGAVGAMGALAPGALAQPGQECGGQGTQHQNATDAHDHANLGNSTEHMGMGHGPGGMMKAQPFCQDDMHDGHM